MEIQIIGKHLEVTDLMREHIEGKLEKLAKYFYKVVEIQIVLKREKYLCIVEITVLGKDLRIYSEARSEDSFFTAFDMVQEKVLAQMKKRREKLKDHKQRGRERRNAREEGDFASLPVSVSESEMKGKGKILKDRDASDLKPMSAEEARLMMETSGKTFVVFRNAKTSKFNVLYRRNDGNFGLIEPEL